MKRLAFWIAAAALLVSAPRLALAFLLADGVHLDPAVEAIVYAGTGIASGLVLTGGNVYLAHALAEHYKRRGPLWLVLLVSWVLFLGFAVVLIAPALVAGLQHSVLAEVLTSPQHRWAWAIVAALSVEVLAAAAMAASVLSAEPTLPSARRSSVSDALSGAAQRLLARVAPAAAPTGEPTQPVAAAAPLPAAAGPALRVLPARSTPVASASTSTASTTGSTSAAVPAGEVVASDAPASIAGPYPCRSAGCPRTFATPQARVAHEARAHRAPEASTEAQL